jgi:ATP-dependent DNA ligase
VPCQPVLADGPRSGPGWLHEIKFDGYRVIARKDGEHVRLWARTTSDYSKAFMRIRDACVPPREFWALIVGQVHAILNVEQISGQAHKQPKKNPPTRFWSGRRLRGLIASE